LSFLEYPLFPFEAGQVDTAADRLGSMRLIT
jgi:hypothetical protein